MTARASRYGVATVLLGLAGPALADEVIVVTGTRSEAPLDASPVVTEVVDREDIEESGAETVADVLATRAGLWLERGVAGTGITIEGLGPEYVLILVDGQRQIGRVGGAIDLDRISAGDIERIEIVRGPGSALYGSDALGGVVHVITRRPEEGVHAEATARIDDGLATDLDGRVAGAGAVWFAQLDGAWRRGDAFDRTPADPATTIAAYDDARAGARAGWRRGDRWRVDAGGDVQRRDLRGVDVTTTGAILDRRNAIEIAQTQAALRWAGDWTRAGLRAGVGFYRDQYVSDQRDAGDLDRRDETRESLVEIAAEIEHARGPHRVLGGGELLREGLSADRLRMPGERIRAALFAQDEVHVADARWILVPAARLDHDTQFGTHATPRLAVRWEPAVAVVARASVGAGYRAPGFKELLLRFENPGAGYVVEGNPELEPERSINAQLGAEWRPRAGVWVAAHAYHNELEDLIAAVTIEPGRFGYDNIGRARTSGVEASAQLARGRVAVELGGGWTRARDLEMDAPLEGVPALRGSAGLRFRDPVEALEASVDVVVTGPRPYGELEAGARVDVRARVARHFGDDLTCFLGIENALDAGDDQLDPIAPRTLYAGVTARR